MAATSAESSRLSRLEVEATAGREVARAITSVITNAAVRTLTRLRAATRRVTELAELHKLKPRQAS